jgi:hypothetical protein
MAATPAGSRARRRSSGGGRPKPFVAVILNFAADFGVLSPGNASGGMESFGSFAAGLHDGAALVESRGASNCLQVNRRSAPTRVFGLSMADLAHIHDALQYALISGGEGDVIRGKERRRNSGGPRIADAPNRMPGARTPNRVCLSAGAAEDTARTTTPGRSAEATSRAIDAAGGAGDTEGRFWIA